MRDWQSLAPWADGSQEAASPHRRRLWFPKRSQPTQAQAGAEKGVPKTSPCLLQRWYGCRLSWVQGRILTFKPLSKERKAGRVSPAAEAAGGNMCSQRSTSPPCLVVVHGWLGRKQLRNHSWHEMWREVAKGLQSKAEQLDKGKQQDKLTGRGMTRAKLTGWENSLCCRAAHPEVADLGRSPSKMFAFINNLLLMAAATTKILLLRTLTSVSFLSFFLIQPSEKIPEYTCLKWKLSYTQMRQSGEADHWILFLQTGVLHPCIS